MQSLSPSEAFGSHQLRWRVIKIYDSHSDSHSMVTAIATCQLPIHFPTDDTTYILAMSDLMSISKLSEYF